eukprot:Sro585_g171020.1 n/a (390) ;mRNA; r:27989-29158
MHAYDSVVSSSVVTTIHEHSLSRNEMKSLACFVKIQAQTAVTTSTRFSSNAREFSNIAREMQSIGDTIERSGDYESKEDYSSASDDVASYADSHAVPPSDSDSESRFGFEQDDESRVESRFGSERDDESQVGSRYGCGKDDESRVECRNGFEQDDEESRAPSCYSDRGNDYDSRAGDYESRAGDNDSRASSRASEDEYSRASDYDSRDRSDYDSRDRSDYDSRASSRGSYSDGSYSRDDGYSYDGSGSYDSRGSGSYDDVSLRSDERSYDKKPRRSRYSKEEEKVGIDDSLLDFGPDEPLANNVQIVFGADESEDEFQDAQDAKDESDFEDAVEEEVFELEVQGSALVEATEEEKKDDATPPMFQIEIMQDPEEARELALHTIGKLLLS